MGLSGEEIDALARLSLKLPAFKGLVKRINESEDEFKHFFQHNTPETCVPVIWDTEKSFSAISLAMMKLLVIQAVRPDRVIAAGHQLVDAVLTESFMPAGERELDLAKIVDTEVKAGTPVLLCSAPGFDASGRLDDLATELNRQITSIAIGSAEGFSQAEKAINSAVKTGRYAPDGPSSCIITITFLCFFFQMGNVEKRPSCAPMAGSAGEEVAFPTAARNVPPVPDN